MTLEQKVKTLYEMVKKLNARVQYLSNFIIRFLKLLLEWLVM